MKTFDDLIHVNPNALSKKVCKDIIKRFKKDDRKKQGATKVDTKYVITSFIEKKDSCIP